jgi:hypothetical protein
MRLAEAAQVAIPKRLALRPRDKRGYPIPYGVLVNSKGVPDFRVTDQEKWMFAAQHRRCGLCGQPLGGKLAFVGGPLCHRYRFFTDLPMHRDCAEYALKVCPYLALPRMSHALTYEGKNLDPDVAVKVSSEVSTEKPERFMLGIAKDFKIGKLPDGSLALQATEWQETVWWKDGEIVGPPPAA